MAQAKESGSQHRATLKKAKPTARKPSKPRLPSSLGKEFTLQTHGNDKYGRTLADVLLSDGTNLNYILIREAWCWWYR